MFNFTIMNTETTNQSRKNLCSICLIDYVNGEEVAATHWLIKPVVMKFDSEAKYKHGITETHLTDCKSLYELRNEIYTRLHGKTIVSFLANHSVSCLIDTMEYFRKKENENKKDSEISSDHKVVGGLLPVFDYVCVHTLAWNAFSDIYGSQLQDICKLIGYEVDINDEFSKARGCKFLLNHIIERLRVDNFYALKQRADITFGERVNYLKHFQKDGKSIEEKVLYLPCCIRRNEDNPHGKINIL